MPRAEKSYQAGPVRITKHFVPWIEGSWEQFAQITARRALQTPLDGGLHYFNPEYTLYAPAGTDPAVFLKQVRRALALWQKRIGRVLGVAARRRAIKREDPAQRPLTFTGILIMNGKSIHPKAWPDMQTAKES